MMSAWLSATEEVCGRTKWPPRHIEAYSNEEVVKEVKKDLFHELLGDSTRER